MILLDPVFISILIFGMVTSYTDTKYGKIKNIHIILLLIAGLLINIFFTKTLLNVSMNPKEDFLQTIINFLITLTFGFFLWSAGLWSQGDAKLFLGYSLLLPVFTYKHGYIPFFPSLVILINTFIPIAIFYILNSFLHAKLKNLKASIKQIISPENLINLALYIFGLSFILQLFLNYFHINLNFIFQMVILFVLMEVLNKISSKATLIFSAIGSIMAVVFSFSSIFTLSFLLQFLSTVVLFSILKLLLSVTEFYSEPIKIKNLKVGMMLSEQLVKTKKGIEKREFSLMTIFDIIKSMKESFLGEVKTRLTDEDVKELQKLRKEGKIKFDEIKITKTVPFAPFMFFGVLLTYFLQGSLLYYFSMAKILTLISKK